MELFGRKLSVNEQIGLIQTLAKVNPNGDLVYQAAYELMTEECLFTGKVYLIYLVGTQEDEDYIEWCCLSYDIAESFVEMEKKVHPNLEYRIVASNILDKEKLLQMKNAMKELEVTQ